MMSYEEFKIETQEKINELQEKIKELEKERDQTQKDKNVISKQIQELTLKLTELETKKTHILKHKFELLFTIIASVPASIILLSPFIIMSFILKDIKIEAIKDIFQLLTILPCCAMTGIITSPIADSLFNIIKDKLLQKHHEKIFNSSEFQNILTQINTIQEEKTTQEHLETEKYKQIKFINNNIKNYSHDISELRSFLNFLTSKTNQKETTLHITKQKTQK